MEEEIKAENKLLRKLLFLSHGCPAYALYGDDGEMQCQACFVDFKRMSAKEIEGRWTTNALQKLWAEKNKP